MSVKLDKYGITGNTGLTGNAEGLVHINANYSANDGYFIWVEDESEISWKRIKKDELKPDMKIITCYRCNKPAVSLDHCFPYLQEHTVCEEHHQKMDMLFKPVRTCMTMHECFFVKKTLNAVRDILTAGTEGDAMLIATRRI